MTPKKTSAEFIEEARTLFGEKYDYSLIKYTGSHHKVRVVCREHGAFDQEARNLLKGRGCPHCSARKPINTERFIAESRKMYGDISPTSAPYVSPPETKCVSHALSTEIGGQTQTTTFAGLQGALCAQGTRS